MHVDARLGLTRRTVPQYTTHMPMYTYAYTYAYTHMTVHQMHIHSYMRMHTRENIHTFTYA